MFYARPSASKTRQTAGCLMTRNLFSSPGNTRIVISTYTRVLHQYVVHQWRNNSLNVRRLLFAYYARTEEEREGRIDWLISVEFNGG